MVWIITLKIMKLYLHIKRNYGSIINLLIPPTETKLTSQNFIWNMHYSIYEQKTPTKTTYNIRNMNDTSKVLTKTRLTCYVDIFMKAYKEPVTAYSKRGQLWMPHSNKNKSYWLKIVSHIFFLISRRTHISGNINIFRRKLQ